MKSLLTTFCLLLVFCLTIQAQDMTGYYAITAQASELQENGEYQAAADKYVEAFESFGGKGIPEDRYKAAQMHAMVQENELALDNLKRLAVHPQVKYKDLDGLKEDDFLVNLHGLEEWDELLSIVEANKREYEKDLDKPLAEELEKIYDLDQKYRAEMPRIQQKYGMDSDEMRQLTSDMITTDRANLIEIQRILDERGWLGPNIVGKKGNDAFFYVLQHAELDVQLKYLPMLRQAVAQDNAQPVHLAMFEDRVNVRQGKPQTFGTQIGYDQETGGYYVEPILEPENVNQYRRSIGLGTIEEYVSAWGIEWDAEEHEKQSIKDRQ